MRELGAAVDHAGSWSYEEVSGVGAFGRGLPLVSHRRRVWGRMPSHRFSGSCNRLIRVTRNAPFWSRCVVGVSYYNRCPQVGRVLVRAFAVSMTRAGRSGHPAEQSRGRVVERGALPTH